MLNSHIFLARLQSPSYQIATFMTVCDRYAIMLPQFATSLFLLPPRSLSLFIFRSPFLNFRLILLVLAQVRLLLLLKDMVLLFNFLRKKMWLIPEKMEYFAFVSWILCKQIDFELSFKILMDRIAKFDEKIIKFDPIFLSEAFRYHFSSSVDVWSSM